jgi:ABC-type transport system involved in cytochrome bd biosynthesis fused ATPase/permease subunit
VLLLDYKTDSIIQTSLRNELRDVTLLTIAHRLQTIMDSDKIVRTRFYIHQNYFSFLIYITTYR